MVVLGEKEDLGGDDALEKCARCATLTDAGAGALELVVKCGGGQAKWGYVQTDGLWRSLTWRIDSQNAREM